MERKMATVRRFRRALICPDCRSDKIVFSKIITHAATKTAKRVVWCEDCFYKWVTIAKEAFWFGAPAEIRG